MIPILYERDEGLFTSNGLGRLADCISCTVTEERNGIYECQFTYPITGVMYGEIQEGRIIGVIHDDNKDIQPFDIYGRSAPLNGVVTFYAHHVSYRLGNVILKPMSATSCVAAMAAIPSHTYNPISFSFWTDKTDTGNWSVEVPTAARAVLGGQEGSILDAFGTGDYEFDKWWVKLHADRGADNGVAIRYGVNMTDLTQNVDISAAYTAVLPYWLGPEGELVTLPEVFVVREGMNIVPVPLDLSSEFEEEPTAEQLRAKATSVLASSRAWLTKENLRVSFIDLAHTEEYKAVAALQRVRLCDKVSVYYGDMDIEAVKVKVVRTVFNVLTERYDEIELGDPKTTLAQTIAAQFSDAASNLPTNVEVRSMLASAVDNATNQITGALGGFVRFMYDADGHMTEILIMDTDDISTATNVWRWNSGGLGFSSNGYDGPYGTAITQDGSIVADYIASGTMDANLIRTGIITSRVGGSYWNLDTGVLMIGSNVDIGGMSAAEIVDNVGSSVTGLDIEFAQSQDSAVAPTTGWSTVAPSWAAGWYIWQRTKTTTPNGVVYSEPTCISGRDGSGSQAGLNQATLYLYQRANSQPAKPSVSMTYTFASGELTNVPAGWSRTIPAGSEPCWVTSAAAISSDTAVTLAANAWQDAVMMSSNGAGIANVVTYFAVNDSTIPPATDQFYELGELIPWTDDEDNVITDDNGEPIYFDIDAALVPTAVDPYVWMFQRTTYTDGTVLDSNKIITAVYGEQGVGVAAIIEEYYLSTSEEGLVGGAWSDRQPEWREGTYIWTRTRITWTDDTVTTTEPILARALNAANEAAEAAAAKADTASAREQLIYRSAASGTITMLPYTTWVTSSANAQNVWTTARPVYSSAYPVLFVATQRQTVEQRSGTACSCTTPVIDQTTTVIDGGHISTGTIDAGVVNVTNLKADNITSGTLDADRIGAGSITAGKIAAGAITAGKIAAGAVTADKLNAGVITSISNAQAAADSAASAASAAQATADSANSVEHLIYISKAEGTTSVSAPTSWVTGASGSQNTWTTRRPVYSSSYPVLFVATQRRNVAGTVTCTTPVIDQTTTVIDGGHIITGSITAGKIAANAITADKLAASVISSINEAQSTANSANSREQTIYHSAESGTSSMSATTTWITTTANSQNVWTTRRPVYSSSYPVLFVATQRRNVAGTVTCTTPVIDQTTTVIDGGHITVGAIDAGRITTGEMSAARIKGGTLTLGGSSNTNGSLVVKDKDGNTIGTWNNAGITAKSLTANDYVYVKGNQDTFFSVPLYPFASSTNRFEISDGGVLLKCRAHTIYRGAAGLHNIVVKFGANQSNTASGNTSRYVPIQMYVDGASSYGLFMDPFEIAMGNWNSYKTTITSGIIHLVKGSDLTAITSGGISTPSLDVSGTKSRSVTTDQYSDRLLYCYETPTPMFGDVGEGVIGEDGLCFIAMDAIFAQTVTTDQYQVFLQRYGTGDCWVRERRPGWFVVQGSPGLSFGWEVKAKQRDYDQLRLERREKPFTVPSQTYGEDAAQHIQDIMKEREIA